MLPPNSAPCTLWQRRTPGSPCKATASTAVAPPPARPAPACVQGRQTPKGPPGRPCAATGHGTKPPAMDRSEACQRGFAAKGGERPPRPPHWSPPLGGSYNPRKAAIWESVSERTQYRGSERIGLFMRLTFKLHDTSPPFVELVLETWRQDVHGGAPIISPHLTTAGAIRRSCANFRAQIDGVEREAIAALLAKKQS